MSRLIVWLVFANVSEEHAASIFRIEEYAYFSTLKMELTRSFETLVNFNQATLQHITENDISFNDRIENHIKMVKLSL
jgi:hypothetical protein